MCLNIKSRNNSCHPNAIRWSPQKETSQVTWSLICGAAAAALPSWYYYVRVLHARRQQTFTSRGRRQLQRASPVRITGRSVHSSNVRACSEGQLNSQWCILYIWIAQTCTYWTDLKRNQTFCFILIPWYDDTTKRAIVSFFFARPARLF